MTLSVRAATEIFKNPPDTYVDVGTGEVAVRSVGRGPDVLFVHGWPVSGATFRKVLPILSEHLTCHVVDLPGAGDSRFDTDTPVSMDNHIRSVRAVVDTLDLTDVALVGHDSGGLIARHAMAGDSRLRALCLMNTEQPSGLNWRFEMFLRPRSLPGFGAVLGWVVGQPWLRRNPFVLGDAFYDSDLLDGEFDDFFLQPIHRDRRYRTATLRLLKSFQREHVYALAGLHAKIDVPVHMVWGEADPFFPVPEARAMVSTFEDAKLDVIERAGLFVHEEKPEEVARLLLPTLLGGAGSAQP